MSSSGKRVHDVERTSVAVEAANKRGRAAGIAAVAAAKCRGVEIINHGAGTMPVDAPAPYAGTRYSLLEDPVGADPPWYVQPHDGSKNAGGQLVFADSPTFGPTLTPAEVIRKGVFGGCYFNPRGGKPGIFGRDVAVDASEFPSSWFDGVPVSMYASRRYVVHTNAHKVKSGFGQREWESKGWIHAQDPRGWFQWYCRFYCGRRSTDDARQIQRWAACASEKGRWRNQLCGAIARASKRCPSAHQSSDHQIIVSSDHRIIRPSDHRIISSSAHISIYKLISASAHQLISSSAHQLFHPSICRRVH